MKAASVIWAVLLGIGVIALAGSILMPSTKRARIDLDRFRPAPPATADADPATAPATTPTPRR